MAIIDKTVNRRVRIEGKPDDVNGYMLTVQDADTGEPITNVTEVTIHVGVGKLNKAIVTYWAYDENGRGKIDWEHDRALKETMTTDNPEMSLTALVYLLKEE